MLHLDLGAREHPLVNLWPEAVQVALSCLLSRFPETFHKTVVEFGPLNSD